MSEVARSRVVSAPVADVWGTLADYGVIVEWAPNVDHSCLLTDGPLGLGSERRIQSGRVTLVERIVEWEPDVRLAYEIEGLPALVKSVVSTWSLVPRGGVTEVTLTTATTVGSRPPQRMVERIAGRRLAKASDEMLGGLAAHHRAKGQTR